MLRTAALPRLGPFIFRGAVNSAAFLSNGPFRVFSTLFLTDPFRSPLTSAQYSRLTFSGFLFYDIGGKSFWIWLMVCSNSIIPYPQPLWQSAFLRGSLTHTLCFCAFCCALFSNGQHAVIMHYDRMNGRILTLPVRIYDEKRCFLRKDQT